MKRVYIIAVLILTCKSLIIAQDKDAYNYLYALNDCETQISDQYLRYASAVSHSKRARKVENRRRDFIKAILNSKDLISKMSCFRDDCSLRDSVISFLTLNYYVLTYSYDKILNMEDIAEQSYDDMELYINARSAADDKVRIADRVIDDLVQDFIHKYNLPVANKKDKMSLTLEQVNKVTDHYNKVFLIFFKSQKQECIAPDFHRGYNKN